MKRFAVVAAVILITSFVFACKTSGGGVPKEAWSLIGTWQDSGGATYTFAKAGGELVCTGIVDYDEEVFQVQQSYFDGGVFVFVYLVPSTGYVVTHRVVDYQGDQFVADWANQYHTGQETFQRLN
jgi:hypothetical protein